MIEQSFHIYDDIHAIAAALEDHPRVDYSGQDASLTHEEVITKTWARLAQSSAWLESLQVYLTVTRVIFYDKGVRHWSCISFLRGQIHDSSWQELTNYTIVWHGQVVTFPRMFDIPIPYTKEGAFYGPEDPRIIVEQGVPDAEPIIIFNMMNNVTTMHRSMYIYRPFSDTTQILSILNTDVHIEKNWTPFLYRPQTSALDPREPDTHIHFVYYLKPLEILKCELSTGRCEFVYTDRDYKSMHDDTGGVVFGGTNFHPVHLKGTQSFVSFPRMHIDRTCKDGLYRPALVILKVLDENEFRIDFASEPLSFGDAATNYSGIVDPCANGRIMILNSIAQWDQDLAHDTMTVSLSIDDYTTQVMRMQGLRTLVASLSKIASRSPHSAEANQDVLECSLVAAIDYGALQYGRSVGYRARQGKKFTEVV